MKISVIVPVKDQYVSLLKVLYGYRNQSNRSFEIIVVDDGSSDMTRELTSSMISNITNAKARIIHQANAGRAAARNVGVLNSIGDMIIFNDGDRVPQLNLVENYQDIMRDRKIGIGYSYDYFGLDLSKFDDVNWDYIEKYSRLPKYYREVVGICNSEGYNIFKYPWMSFMVGNSCVAREVFDKVGLFDERFVEWGGEHFEIGYRMSKAGYSFYVSDTIKNYHIPHSRSKNFYKNSIISSFEIIKEIHNDINIKDCMKYLGIENYD